MGQPKAPLEQEINERQKLPFPRILDKGAIWGSKIDVVGKLLIFDFLVALGVEILVDCRFRENGQISSWNVSEVSDTFFEGF